MKLHKDKILPNNMAILWYLASIGVCLYLTCTSLSSRFVPSRQGSPEAWAVVMLFAFCVEIKTLCFSKDFLYVHSWLLLFPRRIPWSRIHYAEFIFTEGYYFLLFYLDGFTPYNKFSKKERLSEFIQMHPIKVVAMRIGEKKYPDAARKVKKYYPDLKFWNCLDVENQ